MARRIQEYSTPEATVRFDPNLCIHADAVTAVNHCPSGALTVERHGGGVAAPSDEGVRMTVLPSGPLLVRGAVAIEDAEGRVMARMTRAALCRCGDSPTKPFCDNSHPAVRFVG